MSPVDTFQPWRTWEEELTGASHNRLVEVTEECFGEYAAHLLATNSVLPLNRTDNLKAAAAGWNKGYESDRNPEFHSLAIINGERSGITVIDVDRVDLGSPVPPNVLTSKGFHLYKTWEGESRRTGIQQGIDLLGTGGYSIFYGKDKQFKHADLYTWEDLSSLLDAPLPTGQNVEEPRRTKEEPTTLFPTYAEMVEGKGHRLDMKMIEKRLLLTSRNASEGNRNQRLFVVAKQAHQVGIDLTEIIGAFEDAGLDRNEIDDTVEAARLSIEYDTFNLYDDVTMWFDTESGNVNASAVPIMRVIADLAIEQHNLSPWIPQGRIIERLGTVVSQQTVSNHLRGLESKYGALRGVDFGRQTNGRRKVKAYMLCHAGQSIDEVRRQG